MKEATFGLFWKTLVIDLHVPKINVPKINIFHIMSCDILLLRWNGTSVDIYVNLSRL